MFAVLKALASFVFNIKIQAECEILSNDFFFKEINIQAW